MVVLLRIFLSEIVFSVVFVVILCGLVDLYRDVDVFLKSWALGLGRDVDLGIFGI